MVGLRLVQCQHRTANLPTEVEAAGSRRCSQCPCETAKLPRRWLRQLTAIGASSLPKPNSEKEERKGISTLLTRSTTVASARLESEWW